MTSLLPLLLAAALAAPLVACSSSEAPVSGDRGDSAGGRSAPPASARATEPPAASTTAERPRIVVLGDSLTAGYGLPRDASFPALLQKRLDEAGYKYDVVNAGVSGDTSAGGLRRLDWALEGDVEVLVVELGANDGLRGLPVEQMTRNLDEIITRARARKIKVILAGMEAPPNYGPAYTDAFRNAYRELAAKHDIPLIPFLLDGVAGARDLNIADGIHPNPSGARIVEGHVWKALEPVLDRAER